MEAGAFRQDLYYLINVLPIYLPALNARREDLTMLDAGSSLPVSDQLQTGRKS